jgi:hypothetical protein
MKFRFSESRLDRLAKAISLSNAFVVTGIPEKAVPVLKNEIGSRIGFSSYVTDYQDNNLLFINVMGGGAYHA